MTPFFPFPHRPGSFSSGPDLGPWPYYKSEGGADDEVDEKLVSEEVKTEAETWIELIKDEMPETPPSVMEEAKKIEIDVFRRMKRAQSRGIRVGMKDGILRAIGPGRDG